MKALMPVLSLMKNDKMSKRKKAITDYFMQSKKLNKGEDSMKMCQIMNSNADISRVNLT
jgi:hypothetical protein